MSPRRRRFVEKLGSLYLWHRYAGLGIALLAIWLAVTGIMLNHTDDLDLVDEHVEQDWILDAYSIQPATGLSGYHVAGHWVSSSGDMTYIDRQRLRSETPLVGAAPTAFGFVLAFRHQLQLYTPEAVLVETLPFTASAAPITAIASGPEGRVIVTTTAGGYISDAELVEFALLESPEAVETKRIPATPLPESLATDVASDIRRHTLNWERVLLDAHSGRILGKAGVWIADIAGLLMLLLAFSGVMVWYKRWRARRRKGNT